MFEDKRILITGAGGGIGLAIVKNFLPKAAQVISASRKLKKNMNVLLDTTIPSNYQHYSYDLTDESNVKMLFEQAAKEMGGIDIVINTIGGSIYSHLIEDFPMERFDEVISLNLRTAFMITKESIKYLKENTDGGNLLHFVSSSAKKLSTKKAPYGVSKAALARLIHYTAKETAEYNMKVNGISPTYVFTPRHEASIQKKMKKTGQTREQIVKHLVSSQTLKKPMMAEDLLPTTELLASTNVITGQIYNVTLGEIINYW